MNEDETITVTLTLDSGDELECEVLTILEAGGRKYIALLPTSGPGSEDGQVYLYRLIEHGDEEPDLENITEDAEFDLASDAFNAWMEEQDFAAINLDDLD
ncbi:MAG TPA: DUF1292 domain-containing protein [Candidatus Mediterraneibacter norfolkensis]|nr:DUF1292 domain-containing protein [Candidatus Mediterraneibacter norfolkensis]